MVLATWALLALQCLLLPSAVAGMDAQTHRSESFAFFYGANPPWNELRAFDAVVVDPDHVPNPKLHADSRTRLVAYVSVGEVQPSRPYASSIPKAWTRGENTAWGSVLIDQSRPEWANFFVQNVISPLWLRGYQDFFLDTLDSYQLFAKTPEEKARQEAGLVAVVRAIKARYPQARLIFNRGFEILYQTQGLVSALVAESLFQGYDASRSRYTTVSDADRNWLQAQLARAKEELKLPVVVIDYVPVSERPLARTVAKKIADLGFIPWVSDFALSTVGTGSLEVLPRRIAVVHSAMDEERDLMSSSPVRALSLPLSHLGYVPEFVDLRNLPQQALPGTYAGAVVWLTGQDTAQDLAKLRKWLDRQLQDKLPVSLIAPGSDLLSGAMGQRLGLTLTAAPTRRTAVGVVQQDAMMGFERKVRPLSQDFFPLALREGTPLLTVGQGEDRQVAAALAPWGGYVLGSFAVNALPGEAGDRWMIDPFKFLKASLQLPDIPIPDVSTESGRRMFMVHMDGDGFVSRAEMPGFPLAGEVVRDRIVRRYRVPMTISVIEAEVSPKGLYPALAPLAEKAAREIFAEPHVAIASHSYSHPFNWYRINAAADDAAGYNLRIPGYRFDLEREIAGSVRYIEERLAPPGKKVGMFLWTGDCEPVGDAVQRVGQAGILNMNGGDTVATNASPSVTLMAGLGLQRKGGFQVFAPNQNENVYTNGWTGPFYGFEQVIQTFELSEKPQRLKPINIYFHTYLTTKKAGLQSLEKVFAYALAQETTPVFIADYARKVLDFQSLVIARTPSGWRIRGDGSLRTFRVPTSLGLPDLEHSTAVAGYRSQDGFAYAHTTGGTVDLALTPRKSSAPLLVSANAAVESFALTGTGIAWSLKGNVPIEFTLANVQACTVRYASKVLQPVKRESALSYYTLPDHAARSIEAVCRT